jgi:hypothetical protein
MNLSEDFEKFSLLYNKLLYKSFRHRRKLYMLKYIFFHNSFVILNINHIIINIIIY